MKASHEPALTCRLIVTRRNASEILLLPSGSGWALPEAGIHPQRRYAEQLTTEAARVWGLITYCLFLPKAASGGRGERVPLAILESVDHNSAPPAGAYWTPSSSAGQRCKEEDATAIRDSLVELALHANGGKPGPFARPGWFGELVAWSQKQIAPLGLELTGRFRQLNASPSFSLVRLETFGGAVWFKATGEPNVHELDVTLALSELFPRFMPQVLGVERCWNGWLATEVPGLPLDRAKSFAEWERAATELAELQIASIGSTGKLLRARAKDLRMARLSEQVDPFLTQMKELMEAQEKRAPAPLDPSEIATLSGALKEACALVESSRLPDTLGHIDLNPGNILLPENGCVFIDWAEGCVSNPLVTFEYLRQHLGRSGMTKAAAGDCLAAAYLRPWASFYSPEELKRVLAVSPLIAPFAYAVANDSWRSTNITGDPKRAGYLRSLTRRMHRQAIFAAQRSEPCLS